MPRMGARDPAAGSPASGSSASGSSASGSPASGSPASGSPGTVDPVSAYRSILRRRAWLLLLLAMLCLAALTLDFMLGSSSMPPARLLDALFHPQAAAPVDHVIVWNIRLPAALMAGLVGMALGLAGAEMQTILNNPLASPDILGVSSAAAFGASLAIVLNIGLPGVPADWLVAGNAFLFAVASALLLDGAARWGGIQTTGVILFGIALVFVFNALISLVQFIASAEALQNLVFWTMGSLARSTWGKVAALAAAFAAILPLAMRTAWRLTALRLGEDRAASFGVDVRRVRAATLARVSLLSALAVAAVGVIGFIGLVAPHIARRLFGEDHRYYLPGSALLGGIVLSLASSLSKNLVPGIIVPVGIVTALIGIPFFLAVLLRRKLP
jgi:iron complex transport system permease protein